MSKRDEILKGLYEAVLNGDEEKAVLLTKQSIEAEIAPIDAIDKGLALGIKEVGDRFGRWEMFLPEMVASASAMEASVKILEPYFEGGASRKKGKVIMGAVKGDIHDIGMNIVIALLKVNGYEIIELGRDVPAPDFVDKAVELDAQIIGMSGLLTTSMPIMRDVIQMFSDGGNRDKFKILIGGGPTSTEYAAEIGADGYGDTANDAVNLCDQFCG